ncbi:hypothetical protein N3C_2595 [Clostridium sp. N3C]|uniref:DUF1540 domain-containing protein n=1 Tax=Clostridium sp. N3C TaxID=1776758 RepID=UPI00092E03D5|nr:DUF1540 domain-containing protein [Clostridium sp. N3C]SCN25944.1 hypothetical protein N3C_2595 [Clostridium sp. N3C]
MFLRPSTFSDLGNGEYMNGTLSCNAVNCVHNMGGLCSANKIQINGMSALTSTSTQCMTFAEKGFINALMNISNINIPGEIRQLVSKDGIHMYPEVACNAVKCVHNKDQRCEADRVIIAGAHAMDNEGTYCETFAP